MKIELKDSIAKELTAVEITVVREGGARKMTVEEIVEDAVQQYLADVKSIADHAKEEEARGHLGGSETW